MRIWEEMISAVILELSARPQCAQRLCGESFHRFIHRRDAEFAEISQRKNEIQEATIEESYI